MARPKVDTPLSYLKQTRKGDREERIDPSDRFVGFDELLSHFPQAGREELQTYFEVWVKIGWIEQEGQAYRYARKNLCSKPD